jgi:8-oxo-dGTP pyrophosphatase MutT (NUDIX family)
MLLRDAPRGLEVFMLRRNDSLEFSPGAHVFPGGAVDEVDLAPEVSLVCRGRTDLSASRQLGLGSGGLGYWVAAIRECYEEAGVLLARRSDGSGVDLGEDARQALATDEVSLAELCRDNGFQLATDELHYFGHWITPIGSPRRYDTRFFVTRAPADQAAAHDNVEAVGSEWIRPPDALARGEAGRIGLIEPTLRSLMALARFERADDVVESVAAAVAADGTVPMRTEIESRVPTETDGRRVHLPFDDSPPEVASTPLATRMVSDV